MTGHDDRRTQQGTELRALLDRALTVMMTGELLAREIIALIRRAAAARSARLPETEQPDHGKAKDVSEKIDSAEGSASARR